MQKHWGLAIFISVLIPIVSISFIWASARDPGYLEPSMDFLELLSTVHPCEMCPDCRVMRTPRSRHCAICNRCVERFDHHCPWLNNCVGINNNNAFLVFLFSLAICELSIIASCFWTLSSPCDIDNEDCPMEVLCVGCDILALRYTIIVATLCLVIFFSMPVMLLCWIQINNYRLNKTSNERFARSGRTASSTDIDESMQTD